MTLMKSLLLGSAAGIVAIASAQAADLPTRKGAPAAEYVKICTITVNGKPVVGWTLPGSDTCFKLSGYVTGQVEGGNLKDGQTLAYGPGGRSPAGTQVTTPTRGLHATGSTGRPDFGYTTRLNFGFDAVSNTAYGPLTAHAEMQFENGNGFDNDSAIRWAAAPPTSTSPTSPGPASRPVRRLRSSRSPAAARAGRTSSRPTSRASTSPTCWPTPLRSAAASRPRSPRRARQQRRQRRRHGPERRQRQQLRQSLAGQRLYLQRQRTPDFVANLKVSRVGARRRCRASLTTSTSPASTDLQQQTWGWGIDAGVSFNLPTFGAGDEFLVTGAYTQNAAWYSGLPDAMWWRTRRRQRQRPADGARRYLLESDGQRFATPTAWSVSAEFDHHFSPEFVGFARGQLWSGELDGNGLQFGRLQQQQLARRRGRALGSGQEPRFRVRIALSAKPDPNAEWLYRRRRSRTRPSGSWRWLRKSLRSHPQLVIA